MSIAIPFTDSLLQEGIHIELAIRLYEEQVLSLRKAAKLAKMPMESFLGKLAALSIDVVDLDSNELADDLAVLNG